MCIVFIFVFRNYSLRDQFLRFKHINLISVNIVPLIGIQNIILNLGSDFKIVLKMEFFEDRLSDISYSEPECDQNSDDNDNGEANFIDYEEDEVETLNNLCLNSIKSSFDRFCESYCKSQDAVLQRHLWFLQRKYTEELITYFRSTTTIIPDNYVNFLLNENLRNMFLDDFLHYPEDRLIHQMEKIGKKILSFHAGKLPYTSEMPQSKVDLINKMIAVLPNVEEIRLIGSCSNETLQLIASSCCSLQKLDLIFCSDVTANGFAYLSSIPLKALSLRNINVDDNIVKDILCNIHSLETFDCDRVVITLYDLHKDDLDNKLLSNIRRYNLTEIDARNFLLYSDLGCEIFENIHTLLPIACPNLKKLFIVVQFEKEIQHVSCFRHLEQLSIDGANLSTPYVSLNNISTLNSNLKELSLGIFNLSIAIFTDVPFKLNSLKLSSIEFVEYQEKDVGSSFAKLRTLTLHSLDFTSTEAVLQVGTILSSSPNLESLTFTNCTFPDDSDYINTNIAQLSCKNTLRELCFNWSNVKEEIITNILLTCKSLKSLTVEECALINLTEITNLYEIAKHNKVKIHFKEFEDIGAFTYAGDVDDDFYDLYDSDYELEDYEDFDYFDYDEDEDSIYED